MKSSVDIPALEIGRSTISEKTSKEVLSLGKVPRGTQTHSAESDSPSLSRDSESLSESASIASD